MTIAPPSRIRVGISGCLLGQPVRFDGNHKHDHYLSGTLGEAFEFVPVCPEVGIGLGVPRPAIHLIGSPEAPRAVGVKHPELDVTDALIGYGRRMAAQLDGLSGYIFKSKSPSCGLERVRLHAGPDRKDGGKRGVGLYAREILRAHPLLPVEEEGRLGDPQLRDNFLERVFIYHRWQQLTAQRLTPKALVAFHTRHKLAIMAHGTAGYRALGRLIAEAGRRPLGALADDYSAALMHALQQRATARRHTNVLMHVMGYLKNQLDGDDKQELLGLIEAYRQDRVPRIAAITLLRHHFRHHPNDYIAGQTYMNPDPVELKLRGWY
ncbi:MAG: YbgA family protein [Gammaproteobacteria bacterium]